MLLLKIIVTSVIHVTKHIPWNHPLGKQCVAFYAHSFTLSTHSWNAGKFHCRSLEHHRICSKPIDTIRFVNINFKYGDLHFDFWNGNAIQHTLVLITWMKKSNASSTKSRIWLIVSEFYVACVIQMNYY